MITVRKIGQKKIVIYHTVSRSAYQCCGHHMYHAYITFISSLGITSTDTELIRCDTEVYSQRGDVWCITDKEVTSSMVRARQAGAGSALALGTRHQRAAHTAQRFDGARNRPDPAWEDPAAAEHAAPSPWDGMDVVG